MDTVSTDVWVSGLVNGIGEYHCCCFGMVSFRDTYATYVPAAISVMCC